MADHTGEAQLREISARQLGIFTVADLQAAGVHESLLRSRLDSGAWEAIHRGVFRFGGHPVSYRQRVLGTVLSNGPDAVASHLTAAAVWDLPGFAKSGLVEVSKPRGRSRRTASASVHGSTQLPPTHLDRRSSIPVTNASRTLFDLASVLHPLRLARAMDNALGMGLATVGSLQLVLADLAGRGRHGTVLMRDLLARRSEGYLARASELEALALRVICEGGLPPPVRELDIGVGDEWLGRVDLVYRESRLVIELDSRRHHTALLDWEADLHRTNRFIVAGWRVLRFTWDDLVRGPADVVAQIRAALAT